MGTATVAASTNSAQVKSTRKPALSIAPVAPKARIAKRRSTTPDRYDKIRTAVSDLNLDELDYLAEYLEGSNRQARHLPIARAIGKLPEDIRERIYELAEQIWSTVSDDDIGSDFSIAALELADAVKPTLVASQRKLKAIAEGREVTGETDLGGVEKIGFIYV